MTKILDNIILFPGKENKRLIEVEEELLQLQQKLKMQMNRIDFDSQILNDKDLELLANYGDVMFFDSFTARRLISVLSTIIVEQDDDILFPIKDNE